MSLNSWRTFKRHGARLGDQGEVVDHVGVDDRVDDQAPQLAPARRLQRRQHVRPGAPRQQAVHGRQVPVLQHAGVVVHQSQLVPHVHQVCVVHACQVLTALVRCE